MENRQEDTEVPRFDRRHFYRKMAFFDRFLSFDVTLEEPGAMRH
jgi:hypothetical protein